MLAQVREGDYGSMRAFSKLLDKEHIVQHQKQSNIAPARFKKLILICGLMILFCLVSFFYDADTLIGLPTASANAHYGIQGQPAPALNLTTWIDGDGKPIDPIELNDYMGKVLYLYFFQDW